MKEQPDREPGIQHQPIVSRQAQAEALRRAKRAAQNGDPVAYLEAIHESYALDGLKRRLASRWRVVPPDDVDLVLGETVDQLYDAIQRRRHVRSMVGWLFKAAEKQLNNYVKVREREGLAGGQEMDQLAEGVDTQPMRPISSELDHGALEPDEARKVAITMARSLLPQLGQVNVQRVMTLILDALERGETDLPSTEIAEALGLDSATVRQCRRRGFMRLDRLMMEKGWRIRVLEIVTGISDEQWAAGNGDEFSGEDEPSSDQANDDDVAPDSPRDI